MFDIGWQELFVIAAVGIIVVGPKDLPRVLAQLTKYIRKARGIAREFQSSLDDVVRQAELDEIRKEVEKASELNLENEIRNTVDPTGEITRDLDLSGTQSDLDRAVAAPAPLSSGTDGTPTESRPDDPAHPQSG